jgi:hypothetical protein
MPQVAKVFPQHIARGGVLYDCLYVTTVRPDEVAAKVADGWAELAAADEAVVAGQPDLRLLTLDGLTGAVRALTAVEETAAGIDLLQEHKDAKKMAIDVHSIELMGMAGMPGECVAIAAVDPVNATMLADGVTLKASVQAAMTIAAVDAITDTRT